MPRFERKHFTRNSTKQLYGGGPSELNSVEPCTYRELIQHYYFIKNSETMNQHDLINMVCDKVRSVWIKINSNLPIIQERSLYTKVKRLLDTVKQINKKIKKTDIHLDQKLDALFDICKCSCPLETVSCSDKRIKCKKERCQEQHIICQCSPEARVPKEDRLYLKDQRAKIGPRGSYQMSTLINSTASLEVEAPLNNPTNVPIDDFSSADESINEEVN